MGSAADVVAASPSLKMANGAHNTESSPKLPAAETRAVLPSDAPAAVPNGTSQDGASADRIAHLEALLQEKEAVIEALSNSHSANVDEEPATDDVTDEEAGDIAEPALPSSSSGVDPVQPISFPVGPASPQVSQKSIRRRNTSDALKSSPKSRQSALPRPGNHSTAALADPPLDGPYSPRRRSSIQSIRQNSGIPIRVDSSSRRSSLTSLSSITMQNGNGDRMRASDYASDNEQGPSSSSLSLKSPGGGGWTSRFLSPGPFPTGVEPDGSMTTKSKIGSAWKRASLSAVGRRRKNGGSASSVDHSRLSAVAASSASGLGLEPLREAGARSSALPIPPEGFLAPTIASENRRLAVLSAQAQAANTSGSSTAPGGGSSKVIMALTSELQTTKNLLENARSALRASQRSTSAAQRGLEDTNEALGRSRQENENMNRMLERKDRQLAEVMERARKAEGDSKDLGRQSREWGTRVRDIEQELGELRKEKAKYESQYEAIRTAWESTRDRWVAEVRDLRKQVSDRDEQRQGDVDKMKAKIVEMEATYRQRAEEKSELEAVLQKLKEESAKIGAALQTQIDPLSKQADFLASEEKKNSYTVDTMHRELKRILRLARAGDTSGG